MLSCVLLTLGGQVQLTGAVPQQVAGYAPIVASFKGGEVANEKDARVWICDKWGAGSCY